ncbi:hypothetical protein HanPSC8_Chr06g0244711 [Helianthus annuus]|nr:hypothetical protein HanPSC8_Chr06g0244711 [Helianthus annuus]
MEVQIIEDFGFTLMLQLLAEDKKGVTLVAKDEKIATLVAEEDNIGKFVG